MNIFKAKARLQAPIPCNAAGKSNTASFRGPYDAIVRTYQREGLRALYGGFGAVIVGGTPGTVLYLTGYAFFRDTITSYLSSTTTISSPTSGVEKKSTLSPGQEFVVHFSSGILAETVACIIYVPVDVVKERMQVQQRVLNTTTPTIGQSYQYKGSWDAFQKISRTEGIRGIYKGYWATLASFGPFSALYFMFYERCKLWSRQHIQKQNEEIDSTTNNRLDEDYMNKVEDGDLPLLHLVACSSGAGALASWLTSPLDMAKLRLQVQRGQAAAGSNNQTVQYRGMVDCLRAAYSEGGVRGLFRGAGARVLHFAPAMTITMTCYEKCRSFYANALG